MSNRTLICTNCKEEVKVNPRSKNQQYCGKGKCQRARRAQYQRQKMKEDKAYQENQKMCQKEWQIRQGDYYRKWRAKHPGYITRNRELQQLRNMKRSKSREGKMIAKMYSLGKAIYSRKGGLFKIIFNEGALIAKMNSLLIKLIPVQGVRSWQTGGVVDCKK